MPTANDARLLRTVPSTNPDGLDLTVAEARAMSLELFVRTFGRALDDVPLVGPGHLGKAPKDADWYLRLRPAPAERGPKDRKEDAIELVIKPPPQAGAGANPKRTVLTAKDPDAARLEALVLAARKAGRRIRASTWPIERIEGLNCKDLLETYRTSNLLARADGKEDASRKKKTRETYDQAVRVFQRVFPEVEVGDLKGDWLHREYEVRTGRPATSRYADLKTIKLCLNGQLGAMGADYKVVFANPEPPRLQKKAWTAAEYDLLLMAAEGWRFNPDGTPMMVPGPDGLVQARRNTQFRGAWRRAIEFLPYTASRHGRLPLTRWVPPEVEPSDGLPLPENDRPWIEVTDEAIYYHRDGDVPHDGNKGRAGNVIPAECAPFVRAWYEKDMAAGREFVFHKCNGERYRGPKLGWQTFKWIVEDAGQGHRRVPHHLKDLAMEWAEAARLRLEALAEHADTSAKTLSKTYGAPERTALLQEAAEGMTQAGWRAKSASRAAIADRFRNGRTRAAPGPGPEPEAPGKQSEAAARQPAAAGREPDATARQPQAVGRQPEAVRGHPRAAARYAGAARKRA